MRLSLDLKGPELEVALKSNAIQLRNGTNSVEIKVSELSSLIRQLELVTQLISISGGYEAPKAEAAAPAPAAAPAAAPPAPVKAAPQAPPAKAEAPKAAPAKAVAAPAPVKAAPAKVAPAKAAAPAPAKAAAPAPSKAAAPAKAAPAKAAPAPAKAAPAAKPKGPETPLREHFERFIKQRGSASTDELIEFVRKNKLSEKPNLKLAVTIAIGREARRFQKDDNGRWILRD
ncbi:MAG: hypothetical protein AMXMBFR64_03790 [Myxococcales bacterium]